MEILPQVLVISKPLNEIKHVPLTVANKTPHTYVYKVKTTSPKLYCVRPNAAAIGPGETVEIAITRQPKDVPADEPSKDKFMILYAPVESPSHLENFPTIADYWTNLESHKERYGELVDSQKIKVVYHEGSQGAQGSQGVQSAQGTARNSAPSQASNYNGASNVSGGPSAHGHSAGLAGAGIAGAGVAGAGAAFGAGAHGSSHGSNVPQNATGAQAGFDQRTAGISGASPQGAQGVPQYGNANNTSAGGFDPAQHSQHGQHTTGSEYDTSAQSQSQSQSGVSGAGANQYSSQNSGQYGYSSQGAAGYDNSQAEDASPYRPDSNKDHQAQSQHAGSHHAGSGSGSSLGPTSDIGGSSAAPGKELGVDDIQGVPGVPPKSNFIDDGTALTGPHLANDRLPNGPPASHGLEPEKVPGNKKDLNTEGNTEGTESQTTTSHEKPSDADTSTASVSSSSKVKSWLPSFGKNKKDKSDKAEKLDSADKSVSNESSGPSYTEQASNYVQDTLQSASDSASGALGAAAGAAAGAAGAVAGTVGGYLNSNNGSGQQQSRDATNAQSGYSGDNFGSSSTPAGKHAGNESFASGTYGTPQHGSPQRDATAFASPSRNQPSSQSNASQFQSSTSSASGTGATGHSSSAGATGGIAGAASGIAGAAGNSNLSQFQDKVPDQYKSQVQNAQGYVDKAKSGDFQGMAPQQYQDKIGQAQQHIPSDLKGNLGSNLPSGHGHAATGSSAAATPSQGKFEERSQDFSSQAGSSTAAKSAANGIPSSQGKFEYHDSANQSAMPGYKESEKSSLNSHPDASSSPNGSEATLVPLPTVFIIALIAFLIGWLLF